VIETKYKWTVYLAGDLLDIMTDKEVEYLVCTWKIHRIDTERGVIEF
jgi:hypothetical protein